MWTIFHYFEAARYCSYIQCPLNYFTFILALNSISYYDVNIFKKRINIFMRVDETIAKVKEAGEVRGRLYQIHKELKIPYSWLKKLSYGDIENPQAKRIEKLAEYFQSEQQDEAA